MEILITYPYLNRELLEPPHHDPKPLQQIRPITDEPFFLECSYKKIRLINDKECVLRR
jgi:hypothetical protein